RRATCSGRATVPGSNYPVEGVYATYTLENNLMKTALYGSAPGTGGTYWFTQIGQDNVLVTATGLGCSTCSFPAGTITSMYNPDGTLFARSSALQAEASTYYTYDSQGNVASKSQDILDWQRNNLGLSTWQSSYNSF